MKYVVVIIAALALFGCNIERFAPQEELEFVKAYTQQLQAGNFKYLRAHAHDGVRPQMTDDLLTQLADFMPDEVPANVSLLRLQSQSANQTSVYEFRYEFTQADYLVRTAIVHQPDSQTAQVLELYINPIDPAVASNKLSFAEQTWQHYAMFTAMVLMMVFSLTTAIASFWLKASIGKKLIWALASIIGVGSLTLNWSTSAISVSAATVMLFSGKAMSIGGGPWMIGVALPIGAMLFWIINGKHLRHRWQARKQSHT